MRVRRHLRTKMIIKDTKGAERRKAVDDWEGEFSKKTETVKKNQPENVWGKKTSSQ